jgi:hypothetical protein
MNGPKGICNLCGERVEATQKAAYAVTGYEVDRDQGGQNHVVARQRVDGKIWHHRHDHDCFDKFLKGDQQALM